MTCQVPRSVSISTPGSRSRSGAISSATPNPWPRARLAVGGERRFRDAGLARDLEPRLEPGLGVARRSGHVLVVGVHPQLAAGALDDRRRLAVVVGMRVRADDEPHEVEAEPDLRQGALELDERARLVDPGVEEDDAVAVRDRPGVSVRDAGPRQRQAQAPDPGQHALAAAELGFARAGVATAAKARTLSQPPYSIARAWTRSRSRTRSSSSTATR